MLLEVLKSILESNELNIGRQAAIAGTKQGPNPEMCLSAKTAKVINYYWLHCSYFKSFLKRV